MDYTQRDIELDAVSDHLALIKSSVALSAIVAARVAWLKKAVLIAIIDQDISTLTHEKVVQLTAEISKKIKAEYRAAFDAANVEVAAADLAVTLACESMARAGLDYEAPSKNELSAVYLALIMGASLPAWIARLSGDTAFKVSAIIKTAAANGQDASKTSERLQAVFTTAQKSAATTAQAAALSSAAAATLSVLKTTLTLGLKQISVLDSHTSDICRRYSGAMWTMDEDPLHAGGLPFDGGTPRHFGCRSIIVPILVQEAGVKDLQDFVSSKSVTELNSIFGNGRAQLWESGKLTLQQLVSFA